jgi:benzodiazapine receptor
MKTAKHGQDLRWMTLFVVLANTLFNYLTLLWPIGKPIQEITALYPTLFIPADYAFSIWGVIYFSFIIYCIYQLLPAQQDKLLFNNLSISLIFANVLASGWIIAFRNELIGLSMFILLVQFAFALDMYQNIKQARQHYVYTSWLHVPFSLFMGWITVACITNATTWLASIGWWGGSVSEPVWTIILIILTGGTGVIVNLMYKDAVYSLVISWALIAIWVSAQSVHTEVAFTALVAGVAVFIVSVITGIRTLFSHRQYPSYTRPMSY